MINLLTRFYEIDSGSILIDNIAIQELSLHTLRSQIAFVSQDVRLFNDTVAANVAYGIDNPNNDEIIDALKAAYAWDFVKEMSHNIETIVGQDGVKLSGGQRQRIAIARAFYKNAPILILDEATSALDSESEQRIQQALGNLMSKRTTIKIAHRLSTIESADNIIVLDKGQIETGDTLRVNHK